MSCGVVLSDKIVKARKSHRCDACVTWLNSSYSIKDCETESQKVFVRHAEDLGYYIQAGDAYRKITGIHDGRFFTYKAMPIMHMVCQELYLFEEC